MCTNLRPQLSRNLCNLYIDFPCGLWYNSIVPQMRERQGEQATTDQAVKKKNKKKLQKTLDKPLKVWYNIREERQEVHILKDFSH